MEQKGMSGAFDSANVEKPEDQREIFGFEYLNKLIDGGRGDLALLDDALKTGEITEEQHTKLTRKLVERHEIVEGGLVDTANKLEIQVEESGIDPVTKLIRLSRDSLNKKLDEQKNELNNPMKERRGRVLYAILVIALDLDNLKQLNEEYGRLSGDDALKTLATILQEGVRDGFSFRMGDQSDEIIVVIRVENDIPDELIVEKIYKRIRNELNTGSIEIEDGKRLPVTAATGYVIMRPGESRDIKKILKVVDANQKADKKVQVKKARIEAAKARLAEIK